MLSTDTERFVVHASAITFDNSLAAAHPPDFTQITKCPYHTNYRSQQSYHVATEAIVTRENKVFFQHW